MQNFGNYKLKSLLELISIKRSWPFYAILTIVFVFFWKFFINGLIPLPADVTTGVYFPWIDYKWGYEVGVPVKNPILSDVVSVIYPLRIYAAEQLTSGNLPLWMPLMLNGYPLLANFQVAVFSLTFPFYFLFDSLTAWSFQVIVQPIFSASFAYLFLRSLKLNKLSSLAGSIAYAFSGFNMIWLEWNAHSLTSAFIPLVLYLTNKLMDRSSLRLASILSISVGLLIFSGYPQLIIYTAMSVVLFMLFKKARPSTFLLVGVFAFLGVLLTSVQSLPAAELMSNSQRVGEYLEEDLATLPWKHLISIFAPDYLGNHSTDNYWGDGNYTHNLAYTGIVIFVLATLGLLKNWDKRQVKFLFALFVLSISLALRSPFSLFFYRLSIHGSTAASAVRILILTNLSLSFLAAYGINYLWSTKKQGRILLPFLIPAIALLSAFVFAKYTDNNVGLRNLVLPSLLLLASFILVNSVRFFNNYKRIIIILIFLLSVAELFRFGWKFNSFVERRIVFPETPAISYLQSKQKPNRIYFGKTIPMNMWIPFGLESSSGYDAVYPRNISEYNAIGNSLDVSASPMRRFASITNFDSRMFDFANMKYAMFTSEDLERIQVPDHFEHLFTDKRVSVYKNNKALDRAFIIYDWQEYQDKILTNRPDPLFDFSELDLSSSDQLSFSKYSANMYDIKVNIPQDGLLVVSDTFFPGWKVFVNGEEKEILKVNHSFRGVYLPVGKSNVSFIYDPDSFRIGLGLSLIILMFLLYLILSKR